MKPEFIYELQNKKSRYFSQDDFDLGFDPLGDEISSIEGKIDEYEEEYCIACPRTSPYPVESLIKREYCATDKDYFNLYTYECSGVYFIYSKYLNDLFRQSISQSSLEWAMIDNIGYYYDYSFFWREFKYDFEESNNPELVDDTYFAPLIDDTLENLRVDENGFEYYRVSLEPFEEEKLFKEELLFKIENIENITLAAKNSFNEASISEFKNWFYKYFVGHITTNTEIRLLYNWCDKFTKKCLDITLMYLEEKYALYFSNTTEDSIDYYSLLQTIAKIPLEAELFEFIEDDHGVFEDED